MSEAPPRRHDLLHPDGTTWPTLLRQHAESPAIVQDWPARNHPLIQRRAIATDPPDAIPAGLPLPPIHGRQRLAFLIPSHASLERTRPPTLRATRDGTLPHTAPALLHEPIDALLAIAGRHDVEPRIYGSLLWHCLTGLPYLTPTSDLDLLWPIDPARHDIDALLADLSRQQAIPLDGELVRPDGHAAQWRELHRALATNGTILLKSLSGLRLADARAFTSARGALAGSR